MAYSDLREFIATLDAAGELRRISAPVSPELEITEVTDRISKQRGPALLFEAPTGHSIPVLMNAFGSMKRMAMALGVDGIEQVADEIRGLLRQQPPSTRAGSVDRSPTASCSVGQVARMTGRGASCARCSPVPADGPVSLAVVRSKRS